MQETYALHEGAFGRAVVLELRGDLIAHAHAEVQLALWLGGSRAEARVGSKLVRYSEHLALGTNTYESHDARLLDRSGPAVFLVLYIARPWLDERRAATGRPFQFATPGVPIDAAVRQSCWSLLDKIVAPLGHTRDDIDAGVQALLQAAIESSSQAGRPPGVAPRPQTLDHRLRSAISYMRENVHEPVAVEDIAAKVGLSRGHFFALFRDQLNTTPQVFWSAVRVEEAVRRLVHQEQPLTSVAMDLGFSTPGNFSRFFRDHMGVSPSRFRRAASGAAPHLLTGVS
ncbi:helix-turn-helix domain-containing protein [Achromobacter sp. MFA1 R4]|uniref:helix-turn-helix domain-containing protein n=1 Tax=Achromobacter sp. MFA1 R4 TaxID=1881016 RepID=UPI00095396C4|nr:AraC family transcriptional regulator [Achromobacter sp. MFA1 R4]SIT28949.1 AraC-type DNA-binding protein [Achromobacter sp. MFA1 R4]